MQFCSKVSFLVLQSLTFSVLALKTELKKRCSNLLSQACRDQILVWSGVLQKTVGSLSLATQTRLKYQDNLAAKVMVERERERLRERERGSEVLGLLKIITVMSLSLTYSRVMPLV